MYLPFNLSSVCLFPSYPLWIYFEETPKYPAYTVHYIYTHIRCQTSALSNFTLPFCNLSSLSAGDLELKKEMQHVKNETVFKSKHGQQRGRRQHGEGLTVNTDGIIICVSIVHEKASQRWEDEKKEERKQEPSFGEDDIWRLSLFPCHVFSGSCLFLGELLRPFGSYLREIQTSISHNIRK